MKPSHSDSHRNFESGSPSAQTSEAKTKGASDAERPGETNASGNLANGAGCYAPDAGEPAADARGHAEETGEEEIEITEKMIKSGLWELSRACDPGQCVSAVSPEQLAAVYSAMAAAKVHAEQL